MQGPVGVGWRGRLAACACVLLLHGVSAPAQAQPIRPDGWTPEVAVTVGLGHVFRFEDRTYGDGVNVGVGVAARHRRGVGVEVDVDRTFGLTPSDAPCGLIVDDVPAVCIGRGRDGALAATAMSVRVRWEIGRSQMVRPYVSVGPGWLMTRSVWSTATIMGGTVVLTEQEQRDVGVGPDLGVGLRLALRPGVTLSPEVRWIEGAARSRVNLATTRASVRAAWSW